jgi:hypothetical protein
MTAHTQAVQRLSTGKGNALSIGDRIRNLGVKTKRPVPTMLVSGLPLAITIQDDDEDGLAPIVDSENSP